MGRSRKERRFMPPFEVEIERMGVKGVGIGKAPDGAPVWVKPAPPGATLLVAPAGKRKGKWQARRMQMTKKPAAWVEPPCRLFGVCGGCSLQEITLEAQRQAKHEYALREVAEPLGVSLEELARDVTIHPIRGAKDAYGYRNKIELSFGNKRFLTDEEFSEGALIEGRYLGFHAAGRFDRIADTERCWLVDDAVNVLIQTLRKEALAEGMPAPWDAREHKGFWRHAMFRHGRVTGELLIALYTYPAQDAEEERAVEQLAGALLATPLPEGQTLVGVLWLENDGLADVAQGKLRGTWGRDWFEEHLGPTKYQLSYRSFFQTSTHAAVVLYDTIGEALGDAKGTLYDLYCGIGSIGLYLSKRFDAIVGIEEIPEAIEDAKKNAALNGVLSVEYHAAKVEDVLEMLPQGDAPLALVVDPPRAGLHPKVARKLADAAGDTLVYVACHPASFGRDLPLLQMGGWVLTDLWTVDLFPQTGHIELVARLQRNP